MTNKLGRISNLKRNNISLGKNSLSLFVICPVLRIHLFRESFIDLYNYVLENLRQRDMSQDLSSLSILFHFHISSNTLVPLFLTSIAAKESFPSEHNDVPRFNCRLSLNEKSKQHLKEEADLLIVAGFLPNFPFEPDLLQFDEGKRDLFQ
jgi:hypothetical protein